jgi:ribonucleoside-diphosphate reductase alpha chain
MTGRAYRQSAVIASRMGPFDEYEKNRGPMLGVMEKHRAAVANIEHRDTISDDLVDGARTAWDEALALGREHGYRNAQATVIAPTGTISFLMDCDTTGIEPEFSLVKTKKLVGGGELTIVNQTVPESLERLGYASHEIDQIVAHINDKNGVAGAPFLRPEHASIFDCSIGDRAIDYMGHVKMMGAVQPFVSGAISKTANMPESATVEDVAKLYADSWKLGVKALAIYRDNCKVAQPLAGKQAELVTKPQRRTMPIERAEIGRKFQVGEYEGYIHVGLFPDGTPGDVFVDIAKEGTTLAGLMNALMISVSLGIQYGVPLDVYVSKFSHMRFEPAGLTNDPDIRVAKSLVDYIFRWLGKKFLDADTQASLGIMSAEVRARLHGQQASNDPLGDGSAVYDAVSPAVEVGQVESKPLTGQRALFNAWEDAQECAKCGGRKVRTGSCYTCRDCGDNSGCG